MKGKKIVLPVVILLLALWGGRVAYLNLTCERPQIKIYPMGETVHFGENYVELSTENMNGYSIKVNKASVKKTEDFAAEHNITLPERPPEGSEEAIYFYLPEYIYDVEVTITNTGNTEGGIDLYSTVLVSKNILLQVDKTVWGALYPHMKGQMGFKIRENTEVTLTFPFAPQAFEEEIGYVDLNKLISRDFHLMVTKYPLDQRILVKSRQS